MESHEYKAFSLPEGYIPAWVYINFKLCLYIWVVCVCMHVSRHIHVRSEDSF